VTREEERKALRKVLSESGSERTPEVDFHRIAEHLAALPRPSPVRPAPLRLLLAPAALAAAGALFYFAQSEDRAPVAPAPVAAEHQGPANGDQMVPGMVVTAGDQRRTVSHPGRVAWTLEPGSHATLLTVGEVVTIRLDTGSISAEVVPTARPESFAVEVGEFRVAVHGTMFRVAVATRGIDVDVSEGSVLVGPRAQPGTGKLLKGPAAEHFDSPGATLTAPPKPERAVPTQPPAAAGSAEAPDATETALDAAGTAPQAAGTAPQAEATAPLPAASAKLPEPSPGAVDTAALHVIELTSACYRQRSVTAGTSVQTTLRFRMRPDGSISSVTFTPRLARQVELCISDGARSLHGPLSNDGIEVSRSILLQR